MSKVWYSRSLGYAAGVIVSVGLFEVKFLFFLPLVAMFFGCLAMSQIIARLVFPIKWMKDRVGSQTGVEVETFFSRFDKWFYSEIVLAVALTIVHIQVLFMLGVIGQS